MFNIKNLPFAKEQLEFLNSAYECDFEGVWSITENEGISISVFTFYKVSESGNCIVLENSNYRTSGYFTDCIDYMHHWL